MGAVPVAATLNVAVLPDTIDWLAGCVVMLGATTGLVTVRIAALLVAPPAVLVTRTLNCALLSAVVSAPVVKDDAVAPLSVAPFFIHWYCMGAVPVAATLNVAAWPATIFTLAGCDVMAGATAGAGVGVAVPVPLRATEIVLPLARTNCRVPV
jgi:hypothetical protein